MTMWPNNPPAAGAIPVINPVSNASSQLGKAAPGDDWRKIGSGQRKWGLKSSGEGAQASLAAITDERNFLESSCQFAFQLSS